jgi:small-conductance mechanosensitive channel
MSSHLIRQDLIPIVSGYALVMAALATGLLLQRRQSRKGRARNGATPAGGGLLAALRRPGWPRLIRHLAATAVGGYLLLMAIVLLYYYGVAKVAGSFLESAVTGCALLIGLSAPVFAAASWLTESIRRRAACRAERSRRQPAGGT